MESINSNIVYKKYSLIGIVKVGYKKYFWFTLVGSGNFIKNTFKLKFMKNYLLYLMISFVFLGCSKDATDSAGSDSTFTDSDINGRWKESSTGLIIRISSTSSSVYGNGYVDAVGTAYPSGALNGRCMSEVELVSGGYWEAYNWTYYPGTGSVKGSVIGLAMNDARTYFKIGSKFYYRQ